MKVIEERLLSYRCKTVLEQEHAFAQILQELILSMLAKTDFFQWAASAGDTCLRILHNSARFAEGLHFVLEKPEKNFDWLAYIDAMQKEFAYYGFMVESKKIEDPIKTRPGIQNGLLIIRELKTSQSKIIIRWKIDSRPQSGAHYEWKYLEFPFPYRIKTLTLPSTFAEKCYDLVCQENNKGRDWYDFSWYIMGRTPINFALLTQAVNHAGPWQGQNIKVTPKVLLPALENKIKKMDWLTAQQDVRAFLKAEELDASSIWSEDYFLSRLEKLAGYL